MKSLFPRPSLPLLIAPVLAALALAAALAPESRASDPLKGAERLMRPAATTAQPAARPNVSTGCPSMLSACPKCVTVGAARPTEPRRGAVALTSMGQPARPVPTHGCLDCSTSIEVTGHGKASSTAARHSCSAPSPAASGCCPPARL